METFKIRRTIFAEGKVESTAIIRGKGGFTRSVSILNRLSSACMTYAGVRREKKGGTHTVTLHDGRVIRYELILPTVGGSL